MLTPILEEIEQRFKFNKSRKDRQHLINVLEVGFIWDILISRYQTVETTKIFLGFAKDTDLKFILQQGEKFLNKEIDRLEQVAVDFGIPTVKKPAENSLSIFDIEVVSDEYIYTHTLAGIQSYLPTLVTAFSHSTSSIIRTLFQEFLTEELKLYGNFFEYGMIKGWIKSPPTYRN
ncbi:hypothetical protein GGQ84_002495 [Desulfitispora alkaliphila]|uniref:DUF3231 family protein n=1 Tax=Desulfitispora alkaliphila TaxID=622674 RepID=UPI003D19BFF1